jgi:hypothetical protein
MRSRCFFVERQEQQEKPTAPRAESKQCTHPMWYWLVAATDEQVLRPPGVSLLDPYDTTLTLAPPGVGTRTRSANRSSPISFLLSRTATRAPWTDTMPASRRHRSIDRAPVSNRSLATMSIGAIQQSVAAALIWSREEGDEE